MPKKLTSVEICAGGGGQAIGLEQAGFRHIALVDNDTFACATLQRNRPKWSVFEEDLRVFLEKHASAYTGQVDLLAGGVPCPPFSVAGHKRGREDERDMFPVALNLVKELSPRAVMLENVRGLLDGSFEDYRRHIDARFRRMGYKSEWRLLNASEFGVPQLRPRVVCVALKKDLFPLFSWPEPITPNGNALTVGKKLLLLMAANGWEGAAEWAKKADRIAPTLVGGSKKHGGPDLGPTRAKRQWAELGVDGLGLANAAPMPGFIGMPRLTVPMAAVLQGFPEKWEFVGGKTAAYRQVGNAFPPPVAKAVALKIREALKNEV
ncbi:MAG: DNA cytosine methyltransferase [Coriobacteriia bacterium]